MKTKLQLQSVTKTYSSSGKVVGEVSTDIKDCDLVTIVGPSGCGKTTLLRLIAGLIFPTTGKIFCDGVTVDGPSPDRVMMFQGYASFPWLTVRENVEFGLQLQGVPQRRRQNLVNSALKKLHISEQAGFYPNQISGGQQQRVALARTLVVNPNILLLDEPFGALDALTREKMQYQLLDLWHEYKTTILFVTHDIEEAIFLGRRIIVATSRPCQIWADLENPIVNCSNINVKLTDEFVDFEREINQKLREATLKS